MNNLAQSSNVPRSQEDYIIQVSEETESRLTENLSHELSRTGSRILGAPSRLDDFLLNPLVHGHTVTNQETSWNTLYTHQQRNRTTPGEILILKQLALGVRLPNLAQMTLTTFVQSFLNCSDLQPMF